MIGRQVLHAEEVPRVVHARDELEALLRHLLQPPRLQHARVAHQEIQAAESSHAFPGKGLQGHGAGHVCRGEKRPVGPARRQRGGVQLCLQALARGLVEVGDDHVRAFTEESLGNPLAEALRRAGDERDLPRHPPSGTGVLETARR